MKVHARYKRACVSVLPDLFFFLLCFGVHASGNLWRFENFICFWLTNGYSPL